MEKNGRLVLATLVAEFNQVKIHSRLSRLIAARGCEMRFSRVEPTKFIFFIHLVPNIKNKEQIFIDLIINFTTPFKLPLSLLFHPIVSWLFSPNKL